MINSHIQNHPYQEKFDLKNNLLKEDKSKLPQLNADFLRGYIKYAKEKCRPELTEKNREIIKQFYVKLREESKNSGGMNVAVRHIESIIRMSVGKFILIQLMQRCISEVR